MENQLLESALQYAKMGFAVFPVRQNKSPMTPHGCKDAKTDEYVIREWWTRFPDANIGIATGSMSGGIFVIDLDIDDLKGINGFEELQQWELENGALPECWRAITGRGGYHYYFRSSTPVKNRTGLLPGVDIRGEGGYVVAPPSLHQNGRTYEWELAPEDIPLTEANEQVWKFLKAGEQSAQSYINSQPAFKVPERIENGKRNDTLFKLACSLQSRGFPDQIIISTIQNANSQLCDEPVKSDELDRIINSALAKRKGKPQYLAESTYQIADMVEWHEPEMSRDENGKVYQTLVNMREAIEFDKELFGKIRWDSLSYSPYVFGDLPWAPLMEGSNCREWNNTDDAYLKEYIEKRYGLRPSDEKQAAALRIVSNNRRFNPVVEMLEQCRRDYDGKQYIKRLLPECLGAEDSEYTYEVMRVFMLGAIARAYHPGIKFDLTPIIKGPQGCRKSSFVRLLALNDSWFSDNFNTLEPDKAPEKLRGLWIAEMAELLANKRAKEVETIKSFLTSTDDIYRPPYGRQTEHRKRVCVFIGTTNAEHFLTDSTGNRRFLPIEARPDHQTIDVLNYNGIHELFRQAWGEAMKMYEDAGGKPSLRLPEHLEEIALHMQEQYTEDDPRIGIIQAYLDKYDGQYVCAIQVISEALGGIEAKPTRKIINEVHEILQTKVKGWTKSKTYQRIKSNGTNYGVQRCYQRKDADKFKSCSDEDNPFN